MTKKVSGVEQLIIEERFTGDLTYPHCGCICHVSRNGHRKMENKDISARILENQLWLIQIPFCQEHTKDLKCG